MDDDDEEEETVIEPFSSVFARLAKDNQKGGGGGGAKRAASSAIAATAVKRNKVVASTGPPSSAPANVANPSKRQRTDKPEKSDKPAPEPKESSSGSKRHQSQNADDEAIVDGYKSQFDLEKSDDATFVTWCKARVKAVNDLKNSVTTKRKSLKRRSGDISYITEELESILGAIYAVSKMEKGLYEGASVYQAIKDVIPFVKSETDISVAVWERGLKAIAFEDSVSSRVPGKYDTCNLQLAVTVTETVTGFRASDCSRPRL